MGWAMLITQFILASWKIRQEPVTATGPWERANVKLCL